MRVRIIVFGTLFFIGNVALAHHVAEVPHRTHASEESQKQYQKRLADVIADKLTQRGLEREAAEAMANATLKANEVQVKNYLAAMEEVTFEKFVDVVASRVLFGKNTDLANYDTLVALTRTLKDNHVEAQTLEKLREVAVLNGAN